MKKSDSFKMIIYPLHFVPNVADRFKDNRRVHSLAYGKCNYRCEFCSVCNWKEEKLSEYTLESFEKEIWELMRYSKNFKFTGGEPTLNPYLADMLRIVKLYNGQVFLDTNGSRPEKVRALLDENLVDVMGISLKGINREEATATAAIKNSKLCWDNVFETIEMGSKAENVSMIITYVACEGYFKEEDLDTVAKLLSPFPDVTLKINNCYDDVRPDKNRVGLDKSEIYSMVQRFVERHPEYKGRTVLFRDHESCFDNSKIALF